MATNVKSPSVTCSSSASLRRRTHASISTVMEVRPTRSVRHQQLISSPTETGLWNFMPVTATVATRPRAT